jgi:uncharacterized membrane protein HdeD (DUF308 family)
MNNLSFSRFWWIVGLAGFGMLTLSVAIFTNPEFSKVLFIKQSGFLLTLAGVLYGLFYYLVYKAQPKKNAKPYLLATAIALTGALVAYFSMQLAGVIHYLLSFYAIWLGILQLAIAIRSEGKAFFSWLAGGLSFALGVLLIWNPEFLRLEYVIAFYSGLLGIWMLYRALKLKR